mgnify:CR=1 FL=1
MDSGESSMWSRWLDLVLSTDPKQRLRITRSLMSTLVFVICVGLIIYCSIIGLMASTSFRP